MKEYCIYTICNGGEPYILQTYNNLTSAKKYLYDFISDKKYRLKNFIYYVDNDFYDNEFPLGLPKFWYLQIQVRDIEFTPWIKLEKYTGESQKNKIINFPNKY